MKENYQQKVNAPRTEIIYGIINLLKKSKSHGNKISR